MNKISIIIITATLLCSLITTHHTYTMNALAPQKNPTFDRLITQAIISRSPSRATKVLDAHPDSINKLHDSTGRAPLHASIVKCCNSITTLLLERQADINIKSGDEHMTPLYYAVMYGNAKMVTLLLSRKADTEIATKDGLTPLHKAAQCAGPSSLYIFNKLIEAGASIDCKDNNEKTLLDVACSNHIRATIKDLQQSNMCDSASARQIMVDLPSPRSLLASAATPAISPSFPAPTPANAPIIPLSADTPVIPTTNTTIPIAIREAPEINDQNIQQQHMCLSPKIPSINSPQEDTFPHECAAQAPQHTKSPTKENSTKEDSTDEDDKSSDDQEISLEQWVLINT